MQLLHKHIGRILRHLRHVDRNKFRTTSDYLLAVSVFVKNMYPTHACMPMTELMHEPAKAGVIIPCMIQDVQIDHNMSLFGALNDDEIDLSKVQKELYLVYNRISHVSTKTPTNIKCWGIIHGLIQSFIVVRIDYQDNSPVYRVNAWPEMLEDWRELESSTDSNEIDKFKNCPLPLTKYNDYTRLSLMFNIIEEARGEKSEWYSGNGLTDAHPIFDVAPLPLQLERRLC